MRNLLLLALGMLSFSLNAQHNYDNQSIMYSNNGKVGIGLDNPSYKLHISSPDNQLMRFTSTNGVWMDFESTNAGVGNRIWSIGHVGPSNKFAVYQRDGIDQYRLLIDQNGKVGIGTASPESELHLVGQYRGIQGSSGNAIGLYLSNDNTSDHNASSIYFGSKDTSGDRDNGAVIKTVFSGHSSTGVTGNLIFETANNADNPTERMRITGEGNIGIGLNSPSEKLTISDASANHLGLVQSAGKSWQFRVGSTGGLIFKDDGVERMRFLPSGFVGLGTNTPTERMTILDASANHLGLVQSAGKSWQFRVGSTGGLIFKDDGIERMRFNSTGFLGIGTNDPKSMLSVNGKIRAIEVKVLADISVPDYVFESDYELRTLKETKEYIAKNKHLPEIPSANEIGENGIDLGDMNMRLLKKIEELTLYQIELLERLEQIESKNAEIEELKKKVQLLENK